MFTPQAGIFALGTSSHAYLEFDLAVTGKRDALTRYSQPLTGSYYLVPSVEDLRRLREMLHPAA